MKVENSEKSKVNEKIKVNNVEPSKLSNNETNEINSLLNDLKKDTGYTLTENEKNKLGKYNRRVLIMAKSL